MNDPETLIPELVHIAREAGKGILAVYQQDDLGVQTKADTTPVTKADLAANAVIVNGLEGLPVTYPLLSEESDHPSWQERRNWQRYWLIDPLDGTKEFINRNGEFSVNIALIENNYPLLGIVHLPATDTTYWGGKSLGAWKQVNDGVANEIRPRKFAPQKEVIVLGSRSYGTEQASHYLNALKAVYPGLISRKVGSALKSCLIAEGQADIYPRLGPTSEWDTGAVQAVVEGAGGLFLNPDGQRFSYNLKESLINPDFLVLADKTIQWNNFWPPRS
ncbi:3'(2'),5'-bisphosphate nucleotidase CysQ [Endozoicomonas sp. GU-1]|uniref:3'(2'),5'-bisphosphate nucleotidase CysQ n=1 Tax=Endozoicomonas sp. GU-1 TaxID=3009078 RepID=UPI0022B52449|nr:3'(2'),5'-bisphosphate nucleotidase CysQ [Endozoicomonas sp. GU-1]WBA82007.1 3'(2'),5'-bisphosphate nucleotidase CysQ [Endozoicomonas sp. GU-1]WBA84953.1 3'(2'),5'-bisphosphate nucleotidase CysQ [Endozoicomonas sp. GU-1]